MPLLVQRTVYGRNYWTFEYDLESPGFTRTAFATLAIGNANDDLASFGSAVAGRSGGWKRSVQIGGGRWLFQTELFWSVPQGGRVETEQTPPDVHLFTRFPTAFAQNGAAKRPNK
ncbi:hypothetical protein KSP40_PGU006484 [Platanthera guangdongensis]|uniref:Uncharacterized protein n=1 Tax=Platanthera guangdongensis TaxID=2320717 RepID=A0ABR2LTY6_9ASPA